MLDQCHVVLTLIKTVAKGLKFAGTALIKIGDEKRKGLILDRSIKMLLECYTLVTPVLRLLSPESEVRWSRLTFQLFVVVIQSPHISI